MKNRKGLSSAAMILGVGIFLLVGVIAGTQAGLLNIGDDTEDEEPQPEVKDATLNIKASQLGSTSGISTSAYAVLEENGIVSQSLSANQFTDWSNTFTNQMSNVDLLAFDSSNYPIEETISFDGQTTVNEEIKTAQIASASDVSLEARETSGSSDNDDTLKIAAGGQASISSLRASVDIQDKYWNAGAIYVDTPDNSNVTVSMPENDQIAVPDSAPSGVDKAWSAYSPSEGSDDFTEFAEHNSNRIQVTGDDNNDPSETVTFYVDDVQANQNSESGELEYVIEDSSDTNLALAEQSLSATIN